MGAVPSSCVSILNGRFEPVTLSQTLERIIEHVRAGRRGWLCTVNVAILVMMRDDERLQRFVDRAAWVVADGQPLVWAAPMFGGHLPERVTGVDLVEALAERAVREGLKLYFLGAEREVLEQAVEGLRQRHPGLRVAGLADGYFTEAEAPERARAIAESGAHILVVGMGVPRQERFIEEQWERLGVNLAMGVGGSFDVLAGLRRRAPRWVQRLGLEWFYRLAQEPRRLFRRYLVTNTRFLYLLARALLRRGSPAGR